MARESLRSLGRSKTSIVERPKLRKTPPRSKSFNDRSKRTSRRISVYSSKGPGNRYSVNKRASIYASEDGTKWEIYRPRTSGEHDSLWGSDVEEENDEEFPQRPKTTANDSARRSEKAGEVQLPMGFVSDPTRFPVRSTSRMESRRVVPSQELIGVALGSPTHLPLMTAYSSTPKGNENDSAPVLPQHRITLRKSEEAEVEHLEQLQQQQKQLQPKQQKQQKPPSPSKSSLTKSDANGLAQQQKGTWKKLLGKGIFSKRTSGGSKKSMEIIDENQEALNTSGSLLAVDIPKTEMERYSIMFGSVLNPNPSKEEEEEEPKKRLTIFERRLEKDEATSKDLNYIIKSDYTPTSSPPQLRISPKTPRRLNTDHYTDILPLSLFPRTPKTPRTPITPPDEDQLEELRKTLHEALAEVNPEMEPKTPTEFQSELSPALQDKTRRPESDIMPSLMMILKNQEFNLDHGDERKETVTTTFSPGGDVYRGPLSPFSVVSETSSIDIAYEDGIAVSDFPDPPNMRYGAEQVWNWEMLTTPLRARTPISAKIESSPEEEIAAVTSVSAAVSAAREEAAKDEAERLIASAANLSISRQISMSQRQLNIPVVPDSERLYFRPTRLDIDSDVPFDFGTAQTKSDLPPMSAVQAQAIGEARTSYDY